MKKIIFSLLLIASFVDAKGGFGRSGGSSGGYRNSNYRNPSSSTHKNNTSHPKKAEQKPSEHTSAESKQNQQPAAPSPATTILPALIVGGLIANTMNHHTPPSSPAQNAEHDKNVPSNQTITEGMFIRCQSIENDTYVFTSEEECAIEQQKCIDIIRMYLEQKKNESQQQ